MEAGEVIEENVGRDAKQTVWRSYEDRIHFLVIETWGVWDWIYHLEDNIRNPRVDALSKFPSSAWKTSQGQCRAHLPFTGRKEC